jgi:hypothetical protein
MSSFERMEFEGSGEQEFSSEEDFVESLTRKEVLTSKSESIPYGLNRNRKLLASGIVLGLGFALTGCSEIIAREMLERSENNESTNPSVSQMYEEDLLPSQTVTEEGDILVSDPVGPQYTEEVQEVEIQEDEIEEEAEMGRGVKESVVASDTEVAEDDRTEIKEEKKEEKQDQNTESSRVEDVLSETTKEILSLKQELSFNQEGNLYFENSDGEIAPVLMFETERHLTYPYEPLNEVKFFVIHYDAGPLTLSSGAYRTVFNTLNGLNREAKPSVQFCVDPYPITDELVENEGLGVILSQRPNSIPYKGRHVQIGINLETGAEDVNRINTADLYEGLGVGSKFVEFVNSGNKDFNSYSLGVEQVGTKFTTNFPHQFPPNQQIANILALSEAVASRYDLSVWDIVGHHEIQEKSDPGDKYMLTLRYLLGLSYEANPDKFPEDFLEAESLYDYFSTLREYAISQIGEERYARWNEIYSMDEVLESLEFNEK